MRQSIPPKVFNKLIEISDDVNTEVTVCPISPHTRSFKYKLSHHTRRKISSILGKELKASSMQLGVAYYIIESNEGTKNALKFLQSVSEYDTPPTESQLEFELNAVDSDVDIESEYREALKNKKFVEKITTNTEQYRFELRNSTAHNTRIEQMPYIFINNQPTIVNSANDLTKSAMKQFFAEYIKENGSDGEDENGDDTQPKQK